MFWPTQGRHALAGLFRQSVFGRLAGYEDVNDAGPPVVRVAARRTISTCSTPAREVMRQAVAFIPKFLSRDDDLALFEDLIGLAADKKTKLAETGARNRQAP
jgi:hypothetical protein